MAFSFTVNFETLCFQNGNKTGLDQKPRFQSIITMRQVVNSLFLTTGKSESNTELVNYGSLLLSKCLNEPKACPKNRAGKSCEVSKL